jgi:hypothetical protein
MENEITWNGTKGEIDRWLASIRGDMWSRVYNTDISADLKNQLLSAIDEMHEGQILSRHELVDCDGLDGGRIRSTNQIILCWKSRVTLLHELVHSIGGTERDSEDIEAAVYPTEYTEPTSDDYEKFGKEGRNLTKEHSQKRKEA